MFAPVVSLTNAPLSVFAAAAVTPLPVAAAVVVAAAAVTPLPVAAALPSSLQSFAPRGSVSSRRAHVLIPAGAVAAVLIVNSPYSGQQDPALLRRLLPAGCSLARGPTRVAHLNRKGFSFDFK
eukprot:GHVU01069854.1.p2 GENE.GHVU01069854.1~~GHVU01069854.1.p2  ORF type:complete len:123 (+),score=20.27 GHVU01069854.1:585-953(+)